MSYIAVTTLFIDTNVNIIFAYISYDLLTHRTYFGTDGVVT
jgi:hypothetical protein